MSFLPNENTLGVTIVPKGARASVRRGLRAVENQHRASLGTAFIGGGAAIVAALSAIYNFAWFVALWPTYENPVPALVSWILTGHDGFVTAAGYVGPNTRVEHDVSLLVPEVWCRMSVEERDPKNLIRDGFFEICKDFEHQGQKVLASRLGYRITAKFTRAYLGRVFNHPHLVFTDKMLKPEAQDLALFIEGMRVIVATQQGVAELYFKDGSIEMACPPLRALLHIMRDGQFEGKDLKHPELRALFTRESLLSSDWYAARLEAKQTADRKLLVRHVNTLEKFLARANYAEEAARLGIAERLRRARVELERVKSPIYLKEIRGTLGRQPLG